MAAGPDGRRRLLAAPGCYDGFSALLVEQAGFEAAFLSGAALSLARLGRPDVGLVAVGELADAVRAIADRVDIPLIVDIDTGFGNALNTQRTVKVLERAGAAAVQLEDQTFPKRCGHIRGKGVIPVAEMVGKVRAAVDARSETLIIGRTDALGVEGPQAALDRAEAYLEAGADIVFVEGPRTLEETKAVADRFAARVPLVHNLVEGGITALRTGAELQDLGFAIALHPMLLLHGLARYAPEWLATLRGQGTTDGLDILDLPRLNAVAGLDALLADAATYA
ncbi:carboxyvinyl-carboxyphosphonate phosphorylmutase [Caulobacter flavus]|uniref:Carboxyvinyl-carboxyphosphonate phosphorylmutase n=1 Tax=Caulobacter flavus TaxID=1679497 RepID=A0A2N5CPK7_9CAUL|nr:carboxyvinyl-carboxyphosphonate phosphorylmutase [Caulobacter flavus]PLR08886.1 carboxyvinyl-carboxyphosphonate phosphorylmutase [Caulobacter flavus]